MKVTYKKLRLLLVAKDMTKTQLMHRIGCSSSTMAAIGADRNVSLNILLKICEELQCDIGDIMEVIHSNK